MEWTVFVTTLVLMYTDTVLAACNIPEYYRDTWYIPKEYGGGSVTLREKSAVYTTPEDSVMTYDCTDSDNLLFAFRYLQSPPASGYSGVLCMLVDNIPDLGITLQRLNKQENKEAIFEPEVVESTTAITTDTVCQGSDTRDIVVITRQGPGCIFPECTRGLWNSTVLGINITEQNMELRIDNNTSISFQCHRQDEHYYLLRNTKTYLKNDGLMCLKLDVSDYRHQIVLAILKGGTESNSTVKLIKKYKPAYLFVDCKWATFNSTEYILSKLT